MPLNPTKKQIFSKEDNCTVLNPGESVYVNVYSLHWPNGMKMGAYHTGTVVYGKEFGFGGHPFPTSGIFQTEPLGVTPVGDEFTFKESLYMGQTYLSKKAVERLLISLADEFRGDAYHLLHYNCNHFTAHFVKLLCNRTLPSWINRLARFASGLRFVESMLPPEWVRPSLMCDLEIESDDNDGYSGESNELDKNLLDTSTDCVKSSNEYSSSHQYSSSTVIPDPQRVFFINSGAFENRETTAIHKTN